MPLFHLGQTRSSRRHDHLLQTPDTFVRTVLPGMQRALAIVHCGPAMSAAFTQYTAELEAGGAIGSATSQRFLYVLQGNIAVNGIILDSGSYAFVPQGCAHLVQAETESRVAVIEKVYAAHPDTSGPEFFVGCERELKAEPLAGDDAVLVRTLIPGDTRHDFAVNTMTYRPGASLSMVELHIMEHGLLMLEGEGIYRLGDCWYPVSAGDFIWMAPYCPQWFAAVGKSPAKYLIYKDWNRHPL